jgi:pyroglutamyl-peptidase
MSDRTLVTGFGPFQGVEENPSEVLAEASERHFAILPVSFAVVDEFVNTLPAEEFDTWVMLGVAPGCDHIRLELYANNFVCDMPDNEGAVKGPGPVEEGLPDRLGATLWTDAAQLVEAPKVKLSTSPGSYLCNYILYRGLRAFPGKRIGFIHVSNFDLVPLEEQEQALADLYQRLGI